jgi:gluconolactonase
MIAAVLLSTILAAGAELETLFEGGAFTEGPAAAPDGSIYFSDITFAEGSREAGHIWRFDPRTGKATIYRSPSGMANGIAFDPRGRMVVAEGAHFGGRRVTRTDMATGRSERIASLYDGKPFNSPNDVAVDARGRVYFTDPRYVGREPVEQPVQAVYRIDPDGSVHRIITDAGKPNGVAVSPDQKTLYVADTDKPAIRAYDLADDGAATFRAIAVGFPSGGYADGITVDRAGNVYCGCGPLGARVYAPDGKELAAIPTPAEATNVELSRDGRYLYITAGRGLYRIRVRPLMLDAASHGGPAPRRDPR